MAATADDTLLPSLEDTAAGTEIIKAQKMMFAPFPVMNFLLEKNISPRQAFINMYAFLETHHALLYFPPLLDFSCIASIADDTGKSNNMHTTTPNPVFFSNKKASASMKDRVLYCDLPFHNPCMVVVGCT